MYEANMTEKTNKTDKQADTAIVRQRLKRKAPAGIATNDLVFSSHVGNNSEIFPEVLSLYVPKGSRVADVTYGKGVFWKNIPANKYRLHHTDLADGIDCRHLPYVHASFDCVVLDPPYMHTPGGTAHSNHQNYEGYYKNNGTGNGTVEKYHEAVLALYYKASAEALRVLRPEGIFGELDEVSLAYAVTIHKSQGSEFPAVVMPVAMQHFMLLQRNLIHTGITRAKRLLVLVGQKKALGIAVRNDQSRKRYSGLLSSLNHLTHQKALIQE
jgi:hypothetical protein